MSRVVVLAALLLVLGANEALACSCVQPTVEEAVRRADAVFLGTIKTLTFAENPSSRVVVEFEVSRVWKGRVTRKFEMQSKVESFDCEGFFRSDLFVAKELLVFANRGQRLFQKNTYSTTICTLTGPPERYGNTLKMLGESRLPN